MNRSTILKELVSLSYEVGAYIAKEAKQFDHTKIEEKGLNDLVSYVDKTAEHMLVEGLRRILPEAGFVTEEGTAMHKNERYRWIVDPLDGTTNFTHGLPIFAISVALMDADKIIIGAVYEMNRNEMFTAIEGEGAFMNKAPISISKRTKLADSLLATGFPYYDFEEIELYLEILNEFMKSTHGLRRMGSAAVDLAYVACGRFEGFFEYNLNAWDVAAGSLIVQEAGGKVIDFMGENNYLFGRQIIAAGRVLDEMHFVIQKHWDKRK